MVRRRGPRLTLAEKTELWRRWRRGESLNAIGRAPTTARPMITLGLTEYRHEQTPPDYTSSHLALFYARAVLGAAPDVAIVEAAVSRIARTVGDAQVTGTASLPRSLLELAARELLLRGEFAAWLRMPRGQPVFVPASTWTIYGDAEPRTWRFPARHPRPELALDRAHDQTGGPPLHHQRRQPPTLEGRLPRCSAPGSPRPCCTP